MPMHNLLDYNENYSITSESLWNYYKDEVNDSANENNSANDYRINNDKTISKSFKYKAKIMIYWWYTRCKSCCSIKIFE